MHQAALSGLGEYYKKGACEIGEGKWGGGLGVLEKELEERMRVELTKTHYVII